MIRQAILIGMCLQLLTFTLVNTAKQQVQLSDSYLPVAMQVIAHLTDQMTYEVKDEPTPSASKPVKPTVRPTKLTERPAKQTEKPATKPQKTTPKPYGSWFPGSFQLWNKGWKMSYGVSTQTTPFHKPGLYAPIVPPLQRSHNKFILLPIDQNSQYTVIQPQETKTEEPFLSIHSEEVNPLVEPAPEKTESVLPPHFDIDKTSRADEFYIDEEINDNNLQYLSQNVREMIKMAYDPDDERVVDVWETRAGPPETGTKSKLSSSNLRLLLLYDLLSRDAKKQRLNDYNGFSPDVLRELVDSASGGARAQLKLALSKMIERKDCTHDYANNRAKEMIVELGKDESKLSSELRYLQPLVYKFWGL